MTIAIISHPALLLLSHDAGDNHPERPGRVQVIQGKFKALSF